MSKRVLEFFIVDILIACDKIQRYTKGFTNSDDFLHDEKSFDATMRELQIIGEATKHLVNNKLLEQKYRIIVDFRNLIVHEYFGIDADEIWEIINNDLVEFENTLHRYFLNIKDKKLLQKILNFAKDDFKYSKETTELLNTLLNEIN